VSSPVYFEALLLFFFVVVLFCFVVVVVFTTRIEKLNFLREILLRKLNITSKDGKLNLIVCLVVVVLNTRKHRNIYMENSK